MSGITLLHVLRNSGHLDNEVLRRALDELRRRLPVGWKLEQRVARREAAIEGARVTVIAPDRRRASIAVEVRNQIDPRVVIEMTSRLADVSAPVLVVARYLTPAVRERLREAGVGYVDLTGNVRLSISDPGLFVEAVGAESDPNREDRPARSLKGPKAGRVVRALCDFMDPVGVRELAARAGVDPGYVSRLLTLLDREALVDRMPSSTRRRGPITKVDWARLIRRWAEDAPFESRGPILGCIDPRGLGSLTRRLSTSGMRHSVTGALAASMIAPVAPPRLAAVYVVDLGLAVERLELRETTAGANVLLVSPRDDVVFERTREQDGVTYAAPSQIAADLLTGSGRSPAEADALLTWMAANEGDWRG